MSPILLVSFLVAVIAPGEGAVLRLPPVDRCSSDDSFVAFRAELHQILVRRNPDQVLAIVSDDIMVNFGGGAGREEFARAWTLDVPETSRLWHALSEALRLGCIPGEDGTYWAPSLFQEEGIDDPFSVALAIHPGASLHQAADEASPVVATLNWDLVTVPEWNFEAAWQRVEMADGRTGYVQSTDLRSPVDHRAGFRKIDGRWRMITFIAGD